MLPAEICGVVFAALLERQEKLQSSRSVGEGSADQFGKGLQQERADGADGRSPMAESVLAFG